MSPDHKTTLMINLVCADVITHIIKDDGFLYLWAWFRHDNAKVHPFVGVTDFILIKIMNIRLYHLRVSRYPERQLCSEQKHFFFGGGASLQGH